MWFCEVNSQCEISGEGLTSAQVGVWNRFVVSTDCAGPGALHVVIQEANSEERVSPVVTNQPYWRCAINHWCLAIIPLLFRGGRFPFQEAHSKSSATLL